MHRSRVIFSFYCLTGIAAAFLTWRNQSLLGETTYAKGIDLGQSVTKMNIGDGWLTIACFAIILLLVLTGKNNMSLSRRKTWWVSIFAFVSLLISAYNTITILSLSSAKTGDLLVMKTAPGVGLYLTIILSLLLMILPVKQKATDTRTVENQK